MARLTDEELIKAAFDLAKEYEKDDKHWTAYILRVAAHRIDYYREEVNGRDNA